MGTVHISVSEETVVAPATPYEVVGDAAPLLLMAAKTPLMEQFRGRWHVDVTALVAIVSDHSEEGFEQAFLSQSGREHGDTDATCFVDWLGRNGGSLGASCYVDTRSAVLCALTSTKDPTLTSMNIPEWLDAVDYSTTLPVIVSASDGVVCGEYRYVEDEQLWTVHIRQHALRHRNAQPGLGEQAAK